jgi:excisionase family DNA binding protein
MACRSLGPWKKLAGAIVLQRSTAYYICSNPPAATADNNQEEDFLVNSIADNRAAEASPATNQAGGALRGGLTPKYPRPPLTVPEVAAVLRLSKSKVYALIQENVLPALRLPGVDKVLVTAEDLEAFLALGRQRGEQGQGQRGSRRRA